MNIDGVRVLAQEPINEIPNWVFIVAGLLVGCMILVAILVLVSDGNWALIVLIINVTVAFLWAFVAVVCGVFDKPSDRSTYKCIFDEDVSIQEIYDKYEVVGRDGEIWILEDKE